MQAGLVAEFSAPDDLRRAVQQLRRDGYTVMDAYTPCHVAGLDEDLGLRRSRLNWLVFPIAMGGASFAFLLQWFTNGFDFPINVAGRPLFTAPAWIPITFELGVLAAATAAFFLFFWAVRLPRLHHALFEVPEFQRASIDRYWVGISAADPRFHPEGTRRDMESTGALRVAGVGGPP